MRVVLFRENLENVKGRGIFREICENFRVSGGILPIVRKFGRLPNDSGDLATLQLGCTPTLTHCVPCREAVCTIFMMVFGMTGPRGELTTYRARGGHTTD